MEILIKQYERTEQRQASRLCRLRKDTHDSEMTNSIVQAGKIIGKYKTTEINIQPKKSEVKKHGPTSSNKVTKLHAAWGALHSTIIHRTYKEQWRKQRRR